MSDNFDWMERYTWRGRVKRLKMRFKRKNPIKIIWWGIVLGGICGACFTLSLLGG